MKHLLGPTLAVILSTAGSIHGCRISGMPPHDVKLAGVLAGIVSSAAAFGAVLLQSRPRPIPRHR
jgi:hypothetical protein